MDQPTTPTQINWSLAGLHARVQSRTFAENDPYEGYHAVALLRVVLRHEHATPPHLQRDPSAWGDWSDSITRRARQVSGLPGTPSKVMDLVCSAVISPDGASDHDVFDVTDQRRWATANGKHATFTHRHGVASSDLGTTVYQLPGWDTDAVFFVPSLVG